MRDLDCLAHLREECKIRLSTKIEFESFMLAKYNQLLEDVDDMPLKHLVALMNTLPPLNGLKALDDLPALQAQAQPTWDQLYEINRRAFREFAADVLAYREQDTTNIRG